MRASGRGTESKDRTYSVIWMLVADVVITKKCGSLPKLTIEYLLILLQYFDSILNNIILEEKP